MKSKLVRDQGRVATRGIRAAKGGLLLLIRMAGGKSKVARLQETLAKKSRKRKAPKVNSGLVEARAPEPSKELEQESKVLDEVQDSPIPSRGNPALNSVEGESS